MPKVILISGGSDGLGKAIAEKLAPNNHVVILAHNKEKLQAASREIGCDYVEAELTDYESLKSAVNQVIEKHRGLDILINNAGIWMEGELDENDPRKIKEVIDVNTTGTIFLTRAVLPGMKYRKSGQIINIISQDGLCAKKNRSVYHASKWAITGFTKCLQEDLAERNIKVTGIYPGLIKTTLFEKSGVQRDLSDALEPATVASIVEYVINLNPDTHVPEIVIRNNNQTIKNMDNTNDPVIDLNIDPNMIAAQDTPPQATPPTSAPATSNQDIIDITPGASPTPVSAPISNHIDTAPLPEPSTLDITPQINPIPSVSHLSDINPREMPAMTSPQPPVPTTALFPPVSPAPIPAPVAQSTTEPTNTPPTMTSAAQGTTPASTPTLETAPITQSSPLAEDPDLVKLIK